MREYGLPVTILRYSSILAANEVLGVLSPAWLNYFVELAVAKNRIPWFGAEHVDEAKAILADLLETPDAVCAVTDPAGKSWALAFTDVRDVVAGTLLALESDSAVGEAFNMVGPVPVAYTNAARLIADNTDRPYRDVKMPFYWGPHVSNEKARSMLGYSPSTALTRWWRRHWRISAASGSIRYRISGLAGIRRGGLIKAARKSLLGSITILNSPR